MGQLHTSQGHHHHGVQPDALGFTWGRSHGLTEGNGQMGTAVFQRSGHHVLYLQKQCQGWLAGSVTSGAGFWDA